MTMRKRPLSSQKVPWSETMQPSSSHLLYTVCNFCMSHGPSPSFVS